jgi:hypothetical protein
VILLPRFNRRDAIALWLQDRRRARRASLTPPVALLTGLSHYWPLDEATGQNRLDPIGWVDLWQRDAGSGWAGSVPQVAGKVGSAAYFDGTMVGLVGPNSLDWDGTADFTLSGWFYFNEGYMDNPTIFAVDDYFRVNISDGLGVMRAMLNCEAGWASATTGFFTVPVDIWTHFAVVHQGATLRIYQNGNLEVTAAITGTPLSATLCSVHVGCESEDQTFGGSLDEIGLWQRALSVAEVSQLYNNGDGLAYTQF